jgi:hypothetical protein
LMLVFGPHQLMFELVLLQSEVPLLVQLLIRKSVATQQSLEELTIRGHQQRLLDTFHFTSKSTEHTA